MMSEQRCVICAWRGNCAKRFSVSDGGARCPDFSRDVTVKVQPSEDDKSVAAEESKK
jgi:hypothetical protein